MYDIKTTILKEVNKFIYDQINREMKLTIIIWMFEIFSLSVLNERYHM